MKQNTQIITKSSTPIIFTDGTDFYQNLSKTYIKHSHGLFILAPSGSGKTHYVDYQNEKHWIDGDTLWAITGADFTHDEWDESLDDIYEVNIRCDVITQQAKKQGFWVIGSSNLFLKPDAVVIPDWDQHLKYIKKRQDNSYDGGATTENLDDLKMHIDWITKTWHGKVPFFTSIELAISHLTKEFTSK